MDVDDRDDRDEIIELVSLWAHDHNLLLNLEAQVADLSQCIRYLASSIVNLSEMLHMVSDSEVDVTLSPPIIKH